MWSIFEIQFIINSVVRVGLELLNVKPALQVIFNI